MKIFRIIIYGLAGLMFFLTIFTYNYQERSMGMLPVINYPFRDYSLVCAFLIVVFIVIGFCIEVFIRRSEKNGKGNS